MQRNYKSASNESAFTSSKELIDEPLSAEASLFIVMETRDLKENSDYYVTSERDVYTRGIYKNRGVKKLKKELSNSGYYRVSIRIKGKPTHLSVHRLVAEAFVPNPNKLKQVNHINLNKTDNKSSNLEWCSASYNIRHGIANGARLHYKPATGARNARSKITASEAMAIRNLYANKIYNTVKLAKIFNVSGTVIHQVLHNITWRNI